MVMPRAEAPRRKLGDTIVSARLLILQSKRVMLVRAIARGAGRRPDDRVVQLQGEVSSANARYRDSVLRWGAADSSQYWLVAYSTLVDKAEGLSSAMWRAAEDLPQADRTQVTDDARRLDGIIETWRELARTTMAEDVA
jgi:hypothetical protein